MSKAEIRAYCDQIAPAEVVVGDYPDEVKMAPSSPVSTRKQSDESSDHREAPKLRKSKPACKGLEFTRIEKRKERPITKRVYCKQYIEERQRKSKGKAKTSFKFLACNFDDFNKI